MRRLVIPALLLATVLKTLPVQAGEDARAVLARVREYLEWYDRQLVTLVADERYVQRAQPTERLLHSEFGWVTLAALGETIGVREVRGVDGQAVTSAPRLRALLQNPGRDPSIEVRAILAESATHNIGELRRNINFPTLALAYLRRAPETDTKWRAVRAGDHVNLRFEERERSTLIRTPDGVRMPATGRFSVDRATGRIEGCELRVRLANRVSTGPSGLVYRMLVDFAHDQWLGVWVPVRMVEHYQSDEFTTLTGRPAGDATYSNYRRYETGGRLIQ